MPLLHHNNNTGPPQTGPREHVMALRSKLLLSSLLVAAGAMTLGNTPHAAEDDLWTPPEHNGDRKSVV